MRRLAAALAIALASLANGCGGSSTAAEGPKNAQREPEWQDALDVAPDVLVVLRPQALRHDPVYGPSLRQLSQAAAARSPAVASMRALEAFEASEEVLVAIAANGAALIVLRGVRADLDPARIVDSNGGALWRPVSAGGRVPELVHGEGALGASLFVLPQRTWVIATGEARGRARDAFAHPVGRPVWSYDKDALATLRILGPALIDHVPKLRMSGQLSVVGNKLSSATIGLSNGKQGTLSIALSYSEEDAAAESEIAIRHVLDVLRRSDSPRFRWLLGSDVSRSDPRVVTLHARLPKELLEDLAHARGIGEVDVPSPSP